jgi:catalase (peroxidase I)
MAMNDEETVALHRGRPLVRQDVWCRAPSEVGKGAEGIEDQGVGWKNKYGAARAATRSRAPQGA